MKMKARDIVEGWPRGRSTGTFIDSIDDLAWYRMRWTAYAYNPLKGEHELIAQRHLDDLMANVLYHQAQQKMVTEYFERWRCSNYPDSYRFHLRSLGFDSGPLEPLKRPQLVLRSLTPEVTVTPAE